MKDSLKFLSAVCWLRMNQNAGATYAYIKFMSTDMFVLARHGCVLGTLPQNIFCREFFYSLSTHWTSNNLGWSRSLCQMAKSTINLMVLGSGRNPQHHPVPVATSGCTRKAGTPGLTRRIERGGRRSPSLGRRDQSTRIPYKPMRGVNISCAWSPYPLFTNLPTKRG